MLSQKKILEIREHLQNSVNPVFFYDSDADGLASFVLLARWVGKGKGVVVKNFEENLEMYLSKIKQFGSDCVFVLDKPQITQDFINGVREMNLPLVVLDHHDVPAPDVEFYYNSFENRKNKKECGEPVSAICYEVTKQKKDLWIAVVGCVGDCFVPDFFKDFEKENSEWIDCDYKTAFDLRYKCKLGNLIDVFNFGLKDSTTNVVRFQKFLLDINFPCEIFEENSKTKVFLEKYNFLNNLIDKLVVKAEKKIGEEAEDFLYFTYGGSMSVSQHLADKLMYRNPGIVIVLAHVAGKNLVKFSLRGNPQDVQKLVLKSIKGIVGANGGGHKFSAGARIPVEKISEFKKNVLKNL